VIAQQQDLFGQTIAQRFDNWMSTTGGKQAANYFIRLALHCKNHLQKRVGQRAIWEKMRWEYEVERPSGEKYKLNDHFTALMVRFAVKRVPELQGYFSIREVGKVRIKRKVLVISERQAA